MMDCKRANELLIDALYQEVDPAEQRTFDNHIKRCAHCRRELTSLRGTRTVMQEMKDVNPPARLDALILSEAESAAGATRSTPGTDPSVTMSTPVVLQVFVFRDGDFVGTDMFTETEVVVGRDPAACNLVLESTQVSRRHAIIRHDGQRVTIHDAGSTNGIYIGNNRVDGVEVTNFDEMLLGDHTLKAKLVGAVQPMASVPAAAPRERKPKPVREPTPVPAPVSRSERATAVDKLPPPKIVGTPAPASSEWDDVSGDHPVPEPPRADFALDDNEQATSDALETLFERQGVAGVSGTGLPSELSDEPPPRQAAAADDDDEDDEDADYVPPYSLVSQLLQEDAIVTRDRPIGKPHLEVLTIMGDTVAGARLLSPGDSFWIGPDVSLLRRKLHARDLRQRVRLLKYNRSGDCRIELRDDLRGTIKRGRQRVKLDQEPNLQKNVRRQTKIMGLRKGEVLDVVDGGCRYHARFVHAPPRARNPRTLLERARPDRLFMNAMGTSAGAHILGLILVYLLVPTDIVHSTLRRTDDFVEVTLDAAPQVEEVKEKKKEEPAGEEGKPAPPKQNQSKRKASAPGGTSNAPAGVLGLLSKKGSSSAPGPAAAVAAVSNLTAAKVPGVSAGYKVSGLIGKLPSHSLSVGGGGGGLMTKGGAALLRGGGGGGGLARGKSRAVGGLVQKNPKAMRSVGEGTLDRDEIQKVINKHIGQIQRCYERELLKTPGLSGKVQVEWTIATSGKVRTSRQTYTSMNNTSVSNCILGAIRGWVFVRPRGGEVIVNYPFIFKSIGF